MKTCILIGVIISVVCGALEARYVAADVVHTNKLAALRAARSLFDYSWGDFTPRAIVALSYLKEETLDQDTSKSLLIDHILQVMETDGVKAISSVQLAHCINALYASCEDPRDFVGLDLVDTLRLKYDKVERTELKLPLVILTLCIAREATLEDSETLIRIYDRRNDNIAMKALAIIAMAGCKDLTTIPYVKQMKARLSDFMQRYSSQETAGINTKALIIQALNAWKIDAVSLQEQLLTYQAEDGSFGHDLLATYNAIPALLKSSLVDLQCKSRTYKVKPTKLDLDKQKLENFIDLTLIVPEGDNIGKHTIRLSFTGKMSLYQLMKKAAEQSSLYSFSTEEIHGIGKRISSISGISNDPENGMTWVLYKESNVLIDTSEKMLKQTNDIIDYIYPQEGDHYLLQLEMEE